jgi:hypothetical protein
MSDKMKVSVRPFQVKALGGTTVTGQDKLTTGERGMGGAWDFIADT